jgi:hypothetical protein
VTQRGGRKVETVPDVPVGRARSSKRSGTSATVLVIHIDDRERVDWHGAESSAVTGRSY